MLLSEDNDYGCYENENHIDPDIFDVFIKNRVYLDHVEEFLDPEQIDRIDESMIPGNSD